MVARSNALRSAATGFFASIGVGSRAPARPRQVRAPEAALANRHEHVQEEDLMGQKADLEVDGRAVALTAAGQAYDVGDQLRHMLCYLSDGRLFIAKSHRFDPHVTGFKGRLQRMGKPITEQYVDMAVIAEIYARTNSAQSTNRDTPTDMQLAARELFADAVKKHASDIHIRCSQTTGVQIFYRIHNDLQYITENSYEYGSQLTRAIYDGMTGKGGVADSGFNEKAPQDARVADRMYLPNKVHAIRVATSPQVDGHLMVLRLLFDEATESLDLKTLGYGTHHQQAIELMKRRPTGMNIIAGPTGSGKSTSLHRILSALIADTKGHKHVITVEDPPEKPIRGAIQTPVANAETDEQRRQAFQNAIRAAMRLDPNVIMIGEVRDNASARLAIEAAMTGHQVWSTVHANNAFAIIDRLRDLGVEPDLLLDSSILTGLVCQRLVKILCDNCKVPLMDALDRYSPAEINRISQVASIDRVYVAGTGCECCRDTGIAGRTVVAETIVTDQKLMDRLRAGDRMGAINHWRQAQQGKSMLQHAIEKVAEGIVDPFQAEEEVGPLMMDSIESDFTVSAAEVAGVVN